jgi:adenosylcobinamide-GDP ribazoletransferase
MADGWQGGTAALNHRAQAVRFLSRLPVPEWIAPHEQPNLKAVSRWMPLAGGLVSLPSALMLLVVGGSGLSTWLCGMLIVITAIIVTGALHEDGLADCADGFGGGRDRAAKLEIMHDSRIGTYGALAMVASVGIRSLAIADLLNRFELWAAASVLIAAAVISRAAMVHLWATLPPARTDGGLSSRHGMPDAKDARIAAIVAVVAALVLIGLPAGPAALAGGAAATLAVLTVFVWLCRRQVGGHTGDTLGAMQQISEMALYLGLLLAI